MRDNFIKRLARATSLKPGAVRRISFGPCAGMTYKVSEVTGR